MTLGVMFSKIKGEIMDTFLIIAEAIKTDISSILKGAVSGRVAKYRTEDGFIRWGKVESDMHERITHNLCSDKKNDPGER